MIVFGHDRHGRKRRDAGLADGDKACAWADYAQKIDDVFDVFIEAETPRDQRNVAGVVPIGDVDIVIGQHRPSRFTQQCGEVSRHWRDDQDTRAGFGHVLPEMQ